MKVPSTGGKVEYLRVGRVGEMRERERERERKGRKGGGEIRLNYFQQILEKKSRKKKFEALEVINQLLNSNFSSDIRPMRKREYLAFPSCSSQVGAGMRIG